MNRGTSGTGHRGRSIGNRHQMNGDASFESRGKPHGNNGRRRSKSIRSQNGNNDSPLDHYIQDDLSNGNISGDISTTRLGLDPQYEKVLEKMRQQCIIVDNNTMDFSKPFNPPNKSQLAKAAFSGLNGTRIN